MGDEPQVQVHRQRSIVLDALSRTPTGRRLGLKPVPLRMVYAHLRYAGRVRAVWGTWLWLYRSWRR